jgi:hypothetical protein
MLIFAKIGYLGHNASMTKPVNIGFRTTPEIKHTLEKLARDGYRTLSQQVEMVIREWLKEHGHLDDSPSE